MLTLKNMQFKFFSGMIFSILVTAFFASISYADESLEVNVKTSKGSILSGLNIYAFTESGSYTGKHSLTDTSGSAIFDPTDFAAGNYKFRADYLGGQFWSEVVILPETLNVDLTIEEETAEVIVSTAKGESGGTRVYLFSSTGSYLSRYGTTDANGKVSFQLPVGKSYKFRADILGNQYWSDAATITSGGTNTIAVNAGGGILQITIEKGAGSPLPGIRAYLFTASGSYLGKYQTTDSSGIARFSVTEGSFKIRADYMGSQFWTAETTVTDDTSIELTIPHRDVVITVQGSYQGESTSIEGIKTYLFTSSGSYLGQNGTTDAYGHVTFSLPEKSYKVRSDYLGRQFWSDAFTWQDAAVDIPMSDAVITVTGAGQVLEGLRVYLFSSSDSYLGIYSTTDANGKVEFRIPAGEYRFRADYQGNRYWSDTETLQPDQENHVSISTGGDLFNLTVLKGTGDPLADINCHVFSQSDSYLGLSGATDGNGQVSFSLADGTYKIRVDYLGSKFWTDVYSIPETLSDEFTIPHQDVVINIEGVCQGFKNPITGIKVYLFSSSGSYLSKYMVTDENGQVMFNLPEQAYKVRSDYLGKQFWSETFTWQDTTVAIVEGTAEIHVLNGTTDVVGARVYLFSESGSYLGRYETTDAMGKAGFLLPSVTFMFRADYDGEQKWSDNVMINADQTTSVDLNFSDQPVVILSAEPETIVRGDSSVLTWTSENADSVSIDQGIGEVDLNGTITVSPEATTTYTITATGSGESVTDTATVTVTYHAPVVSIHAEPETIPAGVSSVLTWSSSDADSVTLDNGIGAVDLNGSIAVSPVETTVYTITANGPGGTATSTVMVTVNSPPVISIIQPDGMDDTADEGFIIKWADNDSEENAFISLYYDTDDSGADGSLIASELSEDADGSNDLYYWDTTEIPDGTYYIYAVIDDGTNAQVTSYSQGVITIEHPIALTEFKITASDAGSYNHFGRAVSISGDYAIAGSYSDEGDYYGAGSAYIFKRDGDIWVEQVKITTSDGDSDDDFGSVVSISGSYAIVGAPYDETGGYGGEGAGSAYIFVRDGDEWTEQAKLVASDADSYDEFGTSVSISGSYAIVGAGRDDSDSGSAYIFMRDGEVWSEMVKLTASDLSGGAEFGSAVAISGNYAIVGAPYDDAGSGSGVTDSGSSYIFKREGETWSEQAKLTSSDMDEYDEFGLTVSISGEYAVVGERYDDEADHENSGAAYIFKRDGDVWVEQKKLTASDGEADDEFGSAASISGNYAIIGMPYDDSDDGYTDAGSVYVFKRDEADWKKKGRLSSGDADSYDGFGTAVAISGNYAIVGAPYDEGGGYGGYEEGSAYIFKIADDAGEMTADINASLEIINTGETTILTWSVIGADAVSIDHGIGDVDLTGSIEVSPDKTTEYAIAASGPFGDVVDSVTVHVVNPEVPPLVRSAASPLIITEGESAILTWTSSNAYSCVIEPDIGSVNLKGSVSVSPPVGVTTYTISASGAEGSAISSVSIVVISSAPGCISNNGGRYVSINNDYAVSGPTIFRHFGSAWIEQSTMNNTGPVSMNGNYIIVGDYNDNENGSNSGAAYIYKRDGDIWMSQAKLLALNGEEHEYFGWSVSIYGVYAAVGAPMNSEVSEQSGAVYIFKQDGDTWVEQAKLIADDSDALAWFGSSVAINGDYLIVGADGDLDESGSAYIFKLEDNTWVKQSKITSGGVATDYNFGQSVAISDNYAVIGAWASEGWPDYEVGAVYSFKKEGSNWVREQRITADDMCTFQDFGYSVSVSGDYLAVGAPGDGIDADFYGAVYIYKREKYGWQQYSKLVEPQRRNYNKFGVDVSIDGTNVIVGSEGSGSVYIFPITDLDIDLSADVILAGGIATLTWDIENADSVSIDHSIGIVDNSGSIDLSPDETTTYTFTIVYDGMTTVRTVTVYVIDPDVPPAVIISPEQTVIEPGGAATFYWNATNALSCSIDNGVGEVGVNESINVSPDTTTTYTITAEGPAGTATATARVIVKPTVNMSAEKSFIRPGSSTSLIWTSKNAEVCTIEPDIGPVPLNGSLTISPSETTTYTITAAGEGGTAISEITVSVVSMDIDIQYPSDGATIDRPDVMVRGSISNIPNCETGVTVNGVSALVYGNGTYYEFAANHVPLEEGENEITVSIIDADRYMTTSTITVYTEIGEDYITASLDEESGVDPLETTLSLDATFGFTGNPVLTYSGPDHVDINKIDDEYSYTVSASYPGLYYFTAESQYDAETYTDTVALLVNEQDDLDALLKAKWNGMMASLDRGDIIDALTYIAEDSKGLFEYNLNLLSSYLDVIVSGLNEIELTEFHDRVAEYEMWTTYEGETYNFLVRFVTDKDGIWRIAFF